MLRKVGTLLVGIDGKSMNVKGSVKLLITLGNGDKRRTLKQSFMVTKIDVPYNAIFSRSLLNELCTVLSPLYLTMKFEIEKGIASVRRDQVEVKRGACW